MGSRIETAARAGPPASRQDSFVFLNDLHPPVVRRANSPVLKLNVALGFHGLDVRPSYSPSSSSPYVRRTRTPNPPFIPAHDRSSLGYYPRTSYSPYPTLQDPDSRTLLTLHHVHPRNHTGERLFTCHCGEQFSRFDNLRQHAQTVHPPQAHPDRVAAAAASTNTVPAMDITKTASKSSRLFTSAPAPALATRAQARSTTPPTPLAVHVSVSPTSSDPAHAGQSFLVPPPPPSTSQNRE
ncbi:uncharacterized protein B0H18DRAFT_1121188 [Fomitopsis serialis]|uniref:uncharacterized protein n=1 Tax=Fomitopsis serialis TaxID=139415 RepID=UPI00200820AE|nr:uncharacterized protein B0H18DRAFT_1121188 [Neoantrodia serialis]KAH9921892.1 hypothetical protein B0H18DRAFT_1121188 [Neoantrodia serialis]